MSISILEIRNAERETIGIIDTAKSVIWHRKYYGVGDFEIYAQATDNIVELLKVNNYVTRPDDEEIGVIEKITFDFSIQNGYMITAVGRFAKSILDRRIIYKLSGTVNTPTILSGNVEIAIRQLVLDNAIDCTDTRRNISILGLAALNNLPPVIVDENGNAAQKQVSYDNLFEYTEKVLQEYEMSSKIILNNSNRKLLYSVFMGADRSTDNTDNNDPIIFSIDYDNLNSSNYQYDETPLKNTALIGGQGEGLERFYTLLASNKSGLQLRELFVDASSVNRKYKTAGSETEQTYTNAQYRSMLNQKAQEKLKETIIAENFSGDINVSFGVWQYNRDYFLGDIVTVQDNKIDKYINTRIIEATEVQDENGYKVDVVFEK